MTAQKDQLSEKSGIQQITPRYLPQATLQYRTFLKRSMVEALQNAFGLYVDLTLEKTKVGIDYQTSRANFPNIVVKWFEKSLKNMGVGHVEWANTSELTELVAPEVELDLGTGEARKLASTSPLIPGETLVKGPGIPSGTFVRQIKDEHTILLSQKPTKVSGLVTLRFKNVNSDKYIPFHHYLYNGDISLEVYGMSSADRDRVSDAIVEVVAMGTVGLEGETFQNRLYETVGAANFPYSGYHFIVVNTDILTNYGETEELAPWMPEDVWLYKTEYRVPIMGEFYSIVPELPTTELGLVEQVDLHPYHQQYIGTESPDIIPVGDPSGHAYHLLPPSAYPDGVIAAADYIPITHRHVHHQPNMHLKAGASFKASLTPRKL